VHGLPATWFALAGLSLAATGIAWLWWPAADAAAPGPASTADTRALRQPGLIAIYASYSLIAVGLVPHMVFLVDFVARGLGEGIAVGGRYWVLFGIGALLGPLLAGRLADRLGFGSALRAVLVVHVTSAALLAFDHSAAALAISSLIVGSAVSGTVPLVLGQTQERVLSADLQKTAWGIATATFALGQAGGGYAYSFLFSATNGDFELLFVLGATALFLALVTNLLATLSPVRAQPEGQSR
jgi:predicted MFS family arabinose efflux permease